MRDDESIYSLLTGRIARTGEDTVIAEHKTAPGQWTKVTTGEFHNAVLAAAKGLIAFGINKGDAVTIFSNFSGDSVSEIAKTESNNRVYPVYYAKWTLDTPTVTVSADKTKHCFLYWLRHLDGHRRAWGRRV